MLTVKQEKLFTRIKELGRLLDDEEIIDFWIENCSRGTCHTIVTVNGLRTVEDRLWQIQDKARLCYRYLLGQLVINGKFALVI